MNWKRVGLGFAGAFTIAVAALAAAGPASANCLILEHRGALDRLPDGTLVEATLDESQRNHVLVLRKQAAARIAGFLGETRAQPVVVFLKTPSALWPLRSALASTNFAGTRACVIVGPEGRSVDVVAHELMHAELFARIGPWRRHMSIPTWFDEGLAMQVDHRERYNLPPDTPTESVRTLKSPSKFFGGSGEDLTAHFSFAKAEVAKWIDGVSGPNVEQRLDRIRSGEDFDQIFAEVVSRSATQ